MATFELAQLDDDTFMDVWRWDSHEAALAAAQTAPDVPEAAALFSLIVGNSKRRIASDPRWSEHASQLARLHLPFRAAATMWPAGPTSAARPRAGA